MTAKAKKLTAVQAAVWEKIQGFPERRIYPDEFLYWSEKGIMAVKDGGINRRVINALVEAGLIEKVIHPYTKQYDAFRIVQQDAPKAEGETGAFETNDKVVIRKSALYANRPYKVMLRDTQTVGQVVDFDREFVIVEFEGAAADDGISFLPEEIELWKPEPAPLSGGDGWELVVKSDYDALVQERDRLRAALADVLAVMERLRSQQALPIVLSVRTKAIRDLLALSEPEQAKG